MSNDDSCLKSVIDTTAAKLGWDKTEVIAVLLQSVKMAVQKRYGTKSNIEIEWEEETGTVAAYIYREVVSDTTIPIDKRIHITLTEAQKHDKECEVGDEYGLPINTSYVNTLIRNPSKLIAVCKRYVENKYTQVRVPPDHDKKPVHVKNPIQREMKSSDVQIIAPTMQWDLQRIEDREMRTDLVVDHALVGTSQVMMHLQNQIMRAAPTDATVLITGDTGTGKELVGQCLHRLSLRAGQPIVNVNCAAIPDDLIESELFGSEKGAYTGATNKREGKLHAANNGTIFLDEIGDLSLKAQAKILRMLQEREYHRVGGNVSVILDTRIVAATNKDLEDEIAAGRFRQDLFYRLNVINIHIPPLKERIDDVPLLASYFVKQLCNGNSVELPDEIIKAMQVYTWPGNVRELKNAIERLLIMGEFTVGSKKNVLPSIAELKSNKVIPIESAFRSHKPSVLPQCEDQRKKLIVDALNVNKWKQSVTARYLGISPNTLRYYLRKYSLAKPTTKWWEKISTRKSLLM